jgi:DNA-cytosine methyltransferase
MSKLKVFSMFTGVGGIDRKLHTSKNFELTGFCEIDKYASGVLRYHYPDIKNHGDVTKLKTEDVPDHDVLTFGFPCQPYSEAGKRRGLEDMRGQVIYDVFRVLREKKPSYFVAENVKGLLSHSKGETFLFLLECFTACGYAVDFEVLNAKDFGVPQNRQRIFIFGKRLDKCTKLELNFFKEKWKPIKGTSGKYKISNQGRVKSLIGKPKLLKPSTDNWGYPQVVLRIKGKSVTQRIHRLVGKHFVDNPDNKKFINHLNGDTSDNNFLNLEWCTQSENEKHKHNVLKNKPRGVSRHPLSKKWRATITINKKATTIGYYKTKEEAHEAFRKKYIEVHNEEPWTVDDTAEVKSKGTTKSKNQNVVFGYGLRRYDRYDRFSRYLRRRSWGRVLPEQGSNRKDSEDTKRKVKLIDDKSSTGKKSQGCMVYADDGLMPSLQAGCHGYANGNVAQLMGWSSSGRSWGREERITEGQANTLTTGDGCHSYSSKTFVKERKVQTIGNIYDHDSQSGRVYDEKGLAPTIPRQTGGNTVPIVKRDGVMKPRKLSNAVDKGYWHGMDNKGQRTHLAEAKDAELRIRKLTPKECERLMSWPHDWTKYGVDEKGNKKENSKTQRYKMIGNGVVSNHMINIKNLIIKNENRYRKNKKSKKI